MDNKVETLSITKIRTFQEYSLVKLSYFINE